jgi:putative redox protein
VSEPGPQAVRPDVQLELEWLGENRLRGRAGTVQLVLDSPPVAGPSPVQTLAYALASCMAMDVLLVVQRGRFELKGMTARLLGERAPSEPRRLLKVDLHFTLAGAIPPDRVERAIQLSRDKYCSVWHSMRPDIELTTSFEVLPSLAANGTGSAA